MATKQLLYDGPAEWARLPKTGERLEGLSRSHIFLEIKAGNIKSAAIKAPGAARAGQRLIHLPTLRKWIGQHVETVTGE
jgi:hypothetical protein